MKETDLEESRVAKPRNRAATSAVGCGVAQEGYATAPRTDDDVASHPQECKLETNSQNLQSNS